MPERHVDADMAQLMDVAAQMDRAGLKWELADNVQRLIRRELATERDATRWGAMTFSILISAIQMELTCRGVFPVDLVPHPDDSIDEGEQKVIATLRLLDAQLNGGATAGATGTETR